MDRTQLLFSLFDTSGFGLEVGPGYNPLLRKALGFNVETVDHADAPTLREKYKNLNADIEDVTYVSDGRGLLELIGKPEHYDFIVASHVIEHVTDIVRFLQDCSALLKPAGVLVLAVPDKRYCFDTLRPVSTVGQALQAYTEKLERHTSGMLFDYISTITLKNGDITWRDPTLDDLAFPHSVQSAHELFEQSQITPDYHDVHGWKFTPSYFRYFIKTLRSLGYFEIGERQFFKNDGTNRPMHEFYMSLSKNAPALDISDLELLKASHAELSEIYVSREHLKVPRLEKELARVTSELDAVKNSTSWTITAPFRSVKSAFRRQS